MNTVSRKLSTHSFDPKNYLIVVAMLLVLCGLAAAGRAKINDNTARETNKAAKHDIALVAPSEFQPIRADILNDSPSHFTIDVENLANIGADEEAPVFAVYTQSNLPDKCGDFRDLELSYSKPSKYKRSFDLSAHKDVLDAINAYGCIVMRNIPPKG
jgi:hypothetical protein